MEAIHTSTHDDRSGTANETSDKITEKTGNEMRQEGLIARHLAPPPSLNLYKI
jgi:hypothetical protein